MAEKKNPRGRPPSPHGAKSKDPDYVPTTVYIYRETYADTKAALIRNSQDFSSLLNQLLKDWLKEQKAQKRQ
jgi:hypothetical protein